MALVAAMPFSEGERQIQRLMNPSLREDNPTAPTLTQQAAFALNNFPLIALGALDSHDRPWTTLFGGSPPLAQPLGDSIVGVQANVNAESDPVIEALFDGEQLYVDGQVIREDGPGKMIGGLPIHLETRKRVKVFGRMIARTLVKNPEDGRIGTARLFFKVEQSLGNCPKYLNTKHIVPATPNPQVVSTGNVLSLGAQALIQKADLFFISSSNYTTDMDTNHRGGPPGFVRLLQPTDASGSTSIVYPEYSGNRLYQTLGNLQSTPRAGVCFPDFETGDVLYLTGTTETLVGSAAAAILPRSNLAVKITITDSRFVRQGLSFRGVPGERSPYNPPVRPLASENGLTSTLAGLQGAVKDANSATLTSAELLAPTVGRFTFTLDRPALIHPGQWVALDFSDELDIGYSHMRDDDPRSLNDDFVRTFTVSSTPPYSSSASSSAQEVAPSTSFSITVRLIPNGPATSFLFRHIPRASSSTTSSRRPRLQSLTLPVRGFGGSFSLLPAPVTASAHLSLSASNKPVQAIPFVAAGVGITPLLGQLSAVARASTPGAPRTVNLYWSLHRADAPFAHAVLREWREHAAKKSAWGRVVLFLTGGSAVDDEEQDRVGEEVAALQALGAVVRMRRMEKSDLLGQRGEDGAAAGDIDGDAGESSRRWYVCASGGFRGRVRAWLEGEGREVVSEEFDF